MRAQDAFSERASLPESATELMKVLDKLQEVGWENRQLRAALRAVVNANDTIDGAVGTIREKAGDEAAALARRVLSDAS